MMIDASCQKHLTLHFLHDLTYREISVLVDDTWGAVRNRIKRCLKKGLVAWKKKYPND
jgi:DNA-directed RNA polymerase specialized sigma24 family protein